MKKEFKYTIDGEEYQVTINEVEGRKVKLEVNGTEYTAILPEKEKEKEKEKEMPQPKSIEKQVSAPQASPAKAPTPGGAGFGIKAPLPGVIIDVVVKPGDLVKRGQKVAVLEAMKMENTIECDRDGVIIEVKVKKGDSIMEGMDIVTVG